MQGVSCGPGGIGRGGRVALCEILRISAAAPLAAAAACSQIASSAHRRGRRADRRRTSHSTNQGSPTRHGLACERWPRHLTTDVGKCDTDVVTSNVGDYGHGRGPTFFPAKAPALPSPVARPAAGAPTLSLTERVAAVAGLDRAYLETATRAEMEQTLQALLGALKRGSRADLEAGERHGDGSLRITSHIAVWLIGRVSDAYGCRLVKLSEVPSRDSLRSIGGLAELLMKAIEKDRGASAA